MGAGLGVVFGVVDEALVPDVAVFEDELHAAPPSNPSTNVNASSVRDRSTRVAFTAISSFEFEQRTLPPMTDNRDTESVERVIAASPEAIFALLADPSRHHDIDGSGSVQEVKTSPQRVKLGDQFGMSMRRVVPYSTTNTVIEFADDRRIAWHTCSTGLLGKVVGGPVWRYELEPVEGGTRVRESWDISGSKIFKPVLRLERARQDTRNSMTKTLENIEKLLAGA